MNIEVMHVPLIAFLAVVFVMALIQWYLIYARFQIPPTVLPVHPPVPIPVPTPVPKPAPEPQPAPSPQPPPAPGPVPAPAPVGHDFDQCVALVLKYEGGNDDDQRDPGGRTSRGILQSEWNTWRGAHAGLPPDVWDAPQDQVLAIYREKYWNALCCDGLPPGVDLAIFDYGVNSGPSRSAKLLQTLVGTDVDGEVGPETIAASWKADPVSLVGRLCDARLSFLQGLSTWGTFGKGWTSRVIDVRKEALALAAEAPRPKPVQDQEAIPPWLVTMRKYTGTHEGNDNPVILGFATAIGRAFPEMASYCATYTHDTIAWCGMMMAFCMMTAGIRGPFGPTDEDKWMWADSWREWSAAVIGEPQPGDVICVKWPSGGHHVTLYESTNGSSYMCRGGNQSDAINVMAVPKSAVTAIRRPVIPKAEL